MGLAAAGIIGGASLLGGVLGGKGQAKAQKAQNAFMQWLYDPNRIMSAAQTLNPWVSQAMMTRPGNIQGQGFQQDLARIAQGIDISPYTLNQPYRQLTGQYDNALNRFQGMIGRTGGSGGLANAYGLANRMGLANSRANILQQYGQWREGQRRSDIFGLLNQMAQAQGTAAGLASNQGAAYQPVTPWQTFASNAIGGGLGAWGSMGYPGMQQPTPQGITTPNWQNAQTMMNQFRPRG